MRISDWSSDVCSSDLVALVVCRADHLQRRFGVAPAEAHVMLLAVAPDAQVQPVGQRVHHRDANAVEAARHLVGVAVGRVLELTARVELCHDDRSEEHTSELQSLMRISYAVFCLNKKTHTIQL